MSIRPYLILFFLSTFSLTLLAQEDACGTDDSRDPHFSQAHFEKFVQSKDANRDIIEIPIQAHILRKDNGTGGISESTLENALDIVNENYAGSNIQFFYCGPHNDIADSEFYTWWKGTEWFFTSTHNVDSVINIYFANSVYTSDTSSLCGFAKFPWSQDDYIVMKNSCAANISTLSHELGHYFGVYHTHQTGGTGQELVDGSNCLTAGDELCDTPADPKLSSSVVNSFCEYTGSETDNNGDVYKPDATNIMSYSSKSCRDYFSPLQLARIAYYQENARNYFVCKAAVNTSNLDGASDFTLFPNPGNAYLNIQSKNGVLKSVIVHDVQGNHLYFEEDIKGNDVRINTGKLVPGIYFIQIQGSNGIYRQKWIKQF